MSNAALYFHPDAFDTVDRELLGRRSAGESFLRGYLRHADVERHVFYNALNRPREALDRLLARVEPARRPVQWISGADRAALAEVGVLNLPGPGLTAEAWHRRAYGATRYAICGITHTTATERVMRGVCDMMIAPVEDYDALICTSDAVRRSVEAQLGMMRDYLRAEYGPRRRPEAQLATIPLGVNTGDFAATAAHRKAWRTRLDIPDDAVVALYVGRLDVRNKMNPALMAMALERAAKRTARPLYWVLSGWADSDDLAASYHERTRSLCPSVHYRHLDGRPADVRFSIWSVADFFISFSDNIQETFGLTPVEAMAAGLPSVVTDWDGYKDTVRHGVDGFRIPTLAPRPGLGGDLAYAFSNHWISYDNYVGGAAQFTAVDFREAEQAILTLVEQEDLRLRLGASAAARARAVFDWSAVIPQYQALWGEQNARRAAAAGDLAAKIDPYRPDPFTLFANYPTRHPTIRDGVSLAPGMTLGLAKERLAGPLAAYSRYNGLTGEEVEQVFALLGGRTDATLAEILQSFAPPRRAFAERGLLWLARHDVVAITPAP